MARYLVTSALPYINGIKHLGNLVGSMLPADVYSRYLRRAGHDVCFICATDEHGTPAELAAAAAGLPVDQFCAEQHALQGDIYQRFELSFDHFGRSSSPQNHELTKHFAQRLTDAGLIEERSIRQVWSPADGRFLPDRYVEGTCPHCGYDRARGDQCESCTKLLDPTDLLEPRSAISGTGDLEVRESLHLYLRQSALAERIREWVENSAHRWPPLVTSIARKWLDEGLEDRCITRDLEWGVSVDRPGFENKVFYVWFDAPIEYIGATREWADADPSGQRDWKSWWYDADDVTYVQFMAKDNVPFHTITFPATILGSGEPWKMVDMVKGFQWLNYYGGKFSTSQGVGVFMDDALELLPADIWRWYLLANAPETSDTSFTWEHFAATVNKDLADVLGNFVNRAIKFTEREFGPQVPAGGEWGDAERALASSVAARVDALTSHLEAIEMRKAAAELRAIWAAGNEYFESAAPWKQVKTDRDAAACTLRTALALIRLQARLVEPFMPETARRLSAVCADSSADAADGIGQWPRGAEIEQLLSSLDPNSPINVPESVLFTKIEDAQRDDWERRFSGSEVATGAGPASRS